MKHLPLLLAASVALNVVLAVTVGSLTQTAIPVPAETSPATTHVGRPAEASKFAAIHPFVAEGSSADVLPTPPFASAAAPTLSRARAPAALPMSVPSADSFFPATVPPPADDSLGEGRPEDPTAPGNFLSFRGVRVAVAEAYRPPGTAGSGNALGIDVTPETSTSDRADASGKGPLPTSISDSPFPASTTSGFTSTAGTEVQLGGSPNAANTAAVAPPSANQSTLNLADQLFRMRWGWAAFDAARSEAKREAGNRAP